MKAETTKRLFRVVASGDDEGLVVLCQKIIEEERGKGHLGLARELGEILENRSKQERSLSFFDAHKSKAKPSQVRSLGEYALNLNQLPRSRRFNDPLVQLVPIEQLRHHIVLQETIFDRFERIIKEYAARERLAKHGLTHKRKILIYGPPGCGKSLSAEYLAWRTGLPLLKVRFDALISSYFGESAANLRSVFESTINAPCLLFLDECDFIAKSRIASNDVGEVSRLVNTLLTLLEEYKSPGLLLAATNLTSTLDKAVFRRFDDVFEIPRPGKNEIERLLRSTLASFVGENSTLIRKVISYLEGKSASAIVNIANDAAAAAVLEGRDQLRLGDIEAAINKYLIEEK